VNWDAVWESTARITDEGWVVEVKIPYSALRFPKAKEQVWGINMWRHVRRYQSWSTWCFVDNKVRELFNYYGEVKGINNVDPPVRLSFSPYLTGYIEKDPDNPRWSWLLRGGMDVKYGINDSYTLDMMLIPDFGQVQSDDIILNLSPFEVRYDEKRQFFTEGTELFDKCEIFYTRRVGALPRDYGKAWDSLGPDEKVSKNPEETRIINATKISGRNAKGLGLGFFNAMTTNTWATIEDTITGAKISNKSNTLAVFGRLNVSQEYQLGSKPSFGHRYRISVSKPSGKFQYEVFRDAMDNKYKPNDMDLRFELNHYTQFTSFWAIYLEGGLHPLGSQDFYEPRVWGYVYERPLSYDFTWNVATDLRKPFRIHTSISVSNHPGNKNFSYTIGLVPRIRFSDRFTITLNSSYTKDLNDYGWVETIYDTLNNPTILFGRRDISTINNILSASYIFNTKISLSLRVRHYWSKVNYLDFYSLNSDGDLKTSNYWQNHNINFNAFSADLQFIWYFAPGSELSVVWKNYIMTIGDKLIRYSVEDIPPTSSMISFPLRGFFQEIPPQIITNMEKIKTINNTY